MNKRGLSTIITTLILILLVLVAVGIIWVVIANFITTGTDQVPGALGKLTIDLKIDKSSILLNPDNTVSVTVNRGVGTGSLQKINFIISDGNISIVRSLDASDLNELGTKNFIVNVSGVSYVKTISIASGVGGASSGSVSSGNIVDSADIDYMTLLKKGAVLYLPLDGNANDASGDGNNGEILRGVTFVPGKIGNGAYFDGTGGNITILDNSKLSFTDNIFSVVFWMKANDIVTKIGILGKIKKGVGGGYEYSLYTPIAPGQMRFTTWNIPGSTIYAPYNNYDSNWNNFAFIANGSGMFVYGNSVLVSSRNKMADLNMGDTSFNLTIGSGGDSSGWYSMKGIIDEFRIYNRTLSPSEINYLYNLK